MTSEKLYKKNGTDPNPKTKIYILVEGFFVILKITKVIEVTNFLQNL